MYKKASGIHKISTCACVKGIYIYVVTSASQRRFRHILGEEWVGERKKVCGGNKVYNTTDGDMYD